MKTSKERRKIVIDDTDSSDDGNDAVNIINKDSFCLKFNSSRSLFNINDSFKVIICENNIEALNTRFDSSVKSGVLILNIDKFIVINDGFLNIIIIQNHVKCYVRNAAFIKVLNCVIFKCIPSENW